MMAFSVIPAAEPAVNGRVGSGAGAGTIEGALILAYRNNPQLNAQRSSTRATDENVLRSRAIGRGSPARRA
jgi:outer membrane protein